MTDDEPDVRDDVCRTLDVDGNQATVRGRDLSPRTQAALTALVRAVIAEGCESGSKVTVDVRWTPSP